MVVSSDRDRLTNLLSYVTEDDRICPQPPEWNSLWQMLPNRRRDGYGWIPIAPLILAGWWASTDDQKAERLAYHLQWANDHAALDRVDEFLRSLPPERWHRRGES